MHPTIELLINSALLPTDDAIENQKNPQGGGHFENNFFRLNGLTAEFDYN